MGTKLGRGKVRIRDLEIYVEWLEKIYSSKTDMTWPQFRTSANNIDLAMLEPDEG